MHSKTVAPLSSTDGALRLNPPPDRVGLSGAVGHHERVPGNRNYNALATRRFAACPGFSSSAGGLP